MFELMEQQRQQREEDNRLQREEALRERLTIEDAIPNIFPSDERVTFVHPDNGETIHTTRQTMRELSNSRKSKSPSQSLSPAPTDLVVPTNTPQSRSRSIGFGSPRGLPIEVSQQRSPEAEPPSIATRQLFHFGSSEDPDPTNRPSVLPRSRLNSFSDVARTSLENIARTVVRAPSLFTHPRHANKEFVQGVGFVKRL